MKKKSLSLILIFCCLININLFSQNAISFNGVNQYVNTGVISGINQSISVETWIKPNGNTGTTSFERFVDGNYLNNFAFCTKFGSANSILVVLGGDNVGLESLNALTPGIWQHIAFTYNHTNDSLKLFKNGVLIASKITTIPNIRTSTNIVTIGANSAGSEAFKGDIDKVRIWNTARTNQQILDNYQSCLLGNENNLVAYYTFNEGSGTTVTDLTGNGNTGTLINSPVWVTGVNCTYNCSPTYSGGAGTLANPYLISNLNDLHCLSTTTADWNKHFLQTANINANATFWWNNNTGFSPIGNEITKFTGSFNGGNFTISNLKINRSGISYQSLFGYTQNATLSNVNLVNADIKGFIYVAPLVGYAQNSTVTNSSATGIVSAEYFAGGLIALCTGVTVSNSWADVDVSAIRLADNTGFAVTGGLIGDLLGSSLTNCYSLGNVLTNGRNTGGLVGNINGTSSINRCYAKGNVSLTALSNQGLTGGLVGSIFGTSNCNINNCYATGTVTLNNPALLGTSVGGLIGEIRSSGTNVSVTRSYSTGAVIANSTIKGGLIGIRNSGSVTNCFWDTQTSGLATSSGGTGRTTAQMKQYSNFINASWDFKCESANGNNSYWGINSTDNNGYPFLIWEGFTYNCPTWTGNQDSDWSNANNWDWFNGIPSNGTDVTINSGSSNYPQLEVNASVFNINIANNANLIIKPNQTLTVNGTLTNNGTITVESGGALVQGAASTLAGTGNYIVRRAVNAGQKMVGSPINNHSVSGFGITPSGTNGGQIIPQADCNATAIDPSSPYGDIMELREDASPIHNCTQSLWHVKSAGNLTNARGYAVNVAANTTLEFSGTINNGNISYANLGRLANLLDQPSTGQQTGGWHLVSNPYPSPIRLTDFSLGAGWDNSVYFFDGTNFVTSQLSIADAVIPVGQAFQIRKSVVGGSANFSVTNSMREGGNPTFYAPAQLTQEHINVTLSNNQYQSKTTVYFEDGATSNFDPQFDAVKLFGAHYLPQLYTVETSALAEKLAYNALTPLYQENQQSVVMGAFTPTAGDFQLTFDGSNTVSGTVVLEDKKLNTFTNITENLTYSFTTVEGDNMDRFVLHFDATPDNTSARNKMEGTIKMFPNPSADYTTLMFPEKHPFNTINVVDLSGRTVKTFEIINQNNALQIDTKEMNKGIYFVQILGNTNTEVLKLIVK
jgi:hypothetical protein